MSDLPRQVSSQTTMQDIAIRASDDLVLRMALRRDPEATVKRLGLDAADERSLIARRADEVRAALHQSSGDGSALMLTIMICIVDNQLS